VLGGAIAFLIALLTVPFLREIFRFAPVHAFDVLVVLFAGLAGVLWFEAYKYVDTRRKRAVSAR
jgi:Ca2+-transporting ATPase